MILWKQSWSLAENIWLGPNKVLKVFDQPHDIYLLKSCFYSQMNL